MSGFRSIPIAAIDTPRKWRPLKKKTVNELVLSLNQDGLLQPIGVRPGVDPERYVLVFGKHRLEAAKKSGWEEIDAKVFGFDEATARAATDAENLFRNQLAPAEKILAMKSWTDRYVANHPDVHVKGLAGGQARSAKLRAGRGDATAVAPAPSYAVAAAEQTGMSVTQVREYARAGSNLTEEELGILAERAMPLEVIKRINKLGPEARERVIAMIASGMGGHEALERAHTPANATVEDVGEGEAPARTEADLDDDEWLDTYCGEVLDRLKYQVTYRKDAILFRQTQEMRQKLRNAAKRFLKQSRAQNIGPFHHRFTYFLNVDHPSSWLPCGPCGGTGMSGDKAKCGFCHGHAYTVKQGGR
jgi:ParB family chromosome partitioning protein